MGGGALVQLFFTSMANALFDNAWYMKLASGGDASNLVNPMCLSLLIWFWCCCVNLLLQPAPLRLGHLVAPAAEQPEVFVRKPRSPSSSSL